MGLGSAAVKLYLDVWQRNLLANVESVVDMESQELHLTKTRSKNWQMLLAYQATTKNPFQI